MNTFLTVMCLAVVASAAPQSGYNYQQVRQSFRPPQTAGNSGIYSFQQSPPLASFNVQGQQQNVGLANQFNAQVAPAQYAHPVQSSQYLAPVQQQNNHQQTNYQPQQQVIISKDIFVHAAPEETEEIGNDLGVEPGPIRKNYRIVFVKAPSQNIKLNLASLKRAQASNEEKTVIYVLSKKPDIANIQSQLAAVQTEQKAHKPEVYFIKYRTQEEANRAQQEIQAQYDSLGGSTSISNEGIAPVTSVIGGGHVNIGSGGSSFTGGSGNSVGTSFTGGNGGSFNGGSTTGSIQQQQFVQQSYQSSQGSSSSAASFDGVPSQEYLPSKKK